MLWGLVLLVAAAVLASSSYVEIYVEEGPPLMPSDNVFVHNGRNWVPVNVVLVPDIVPTYVVASGAWVEMPYYRLDRYVLEIPREALGRRARPPHGYTQWILKTEDGKETTLAVGPPMRSGEVELGTWYRLVQTPHMNYQKGRISRETDQRRDPERGSGIHEVRHVEEGKDGAARSAEELSQLRITSVSGTLFVGGTIYFAPLRVSGTFDVYVPPHHMEKDLLVCGNAITNWVGYESIPGNLRIGIVVEGGTISGGSVQIELVGPDCRPVASVTIPFEGSGVFYREVYTILAAGRSTVIYEGES